jgi:hypothetical protein
VKFCFLIVFSAFSYLFCAQTNESLPEIKEDTTKHSVKKAVIFSSVLPGAGQVYNHLAMPKGKKNAFWKVPIIYAGLGATGYVLLNNNRLQKELKNEYLNRDAGKLGLQKYEQYDDEGVISLYYQHLNRRDLFIIAFGAVYLFQILDAAVEAHFVTFDISEDLSLKITPSIYTPNQAGLTFNLTFK